MFRGKSYTAIQLTEDSTITNTLNTSVVLWFYWTNQLIILGWRILSGDNSKQVLQDDDHNKVKQLQWLELYKSSATDKKSSRSYQ